MSYYIYLFHDRIIYWLPRTPDSKPIEVSWANWYIVNNPPPIPLDEMVKRGDVSYNMQQGFHILENEPFPKNWDQRSKFVKKIELLAGLNNLANSHKARYTDSAVGQALTDALTLEEIREYRATGSLDNCAILTSLMETSESGLTAEALVTKLWLTYESYRNVIAYLNHLEARVRKLLQDNQLDEATALLNHEVDKLRL